MTIHRYSERLTRHKWLAENLGLPDFYWASQNEDVRTPLIAWLEAWYRRLFLGEARPPTYLFLWGPNGVGKSTLIARGLARFHMLNLGCASFDYLPWAAFVDDQLNGEQMHPNWDAQLLVVDGLDERRPIPESLSTWLLDKLSSRLKHRAEFLHYPTIITSNRNPMAMDEFLGSSTTGNRNDDTRQSVTTLITAFSLHCFDTVAFKPSKVKRPATMKSPEYNQRLIDNAHKHNDMKALGFHFLEEKYGEETWWQPKDE